MSPFPCQGSKNSRSRSLELQDTKEKKKLQNRIAQRTYRRNQKQRMQALEDAVAQATTTREDIVGTETINLRALDFNTAPSKLPCASEMPTSGPSAMYGLDSIVPAEDLAKVPMLNGGWGETSTGGDLPIVRPALHRAASRGDESMCQLLINRGAEIGKFDGNGITALHVAVAAGNLAIMRQMLEKNHANVKDVIGRTALFSAVQSKNETAVQLMLDFKVDIDCRDVLGEVALHLAVEEGSESIVTILLEHGANIDS